MASNKKPEFQVFVTTGKSGEEFYHNIGAAWKVDKDGLSIKLSSLPINGEMVIFPSKEKKDKE